MGEDEAWELVKKIKFIYDRLPVFLQRKVDKNRRDYLDFPEIGSRIKALSSTINAGSGYTATLVIRDELDKHPYAEENFSAIKPTVDSGGRLIDLGSRDYTVAKDSSHLMTRYLKAKTGEINAKAVFIGWKARPVRDEGMSLEDWFKSIKADYTPYQLEKEYPETEDDILQDAQTVRFFGKDGVDFIRRDCSSPIETDFDGMVKIWKRPEPGLKYCAFLDPSDGSDPHAAGWLDTATGEVVAISHGKCRVEKCAEIFDKYCRFYNNAFNEFELNNFAGKKTAEILLSLGTPNRRTSVVSKDRANKYGWWTGGNTDSNKNIRTLMLTTLEAAVNNKSIRIHYGAVADELDSMMKTEKDGIKVPSGKHDDLLMMLGGLLLIRKDFKIIGTTTFKSFQRTSTSYA